ncbi:STAS domain-containing protein [Methylomonas sp. AM2-LC]|uniref:STAS domain-containing protein n=1 Tax=Methylomonas sp. AM2-LC TaxID=3153301 RepID=UPI003264A24C
MSNMALSLKAPGLFSIAGELTFASITKQTVNSFNLLKDSDNVCIDLADVSATDSAGLALMIEWIRLSKQHNKHISFKNIPEQLIALAKLSGLDVNEHFASTEHQASCLTK